MLLTRRFVAAWKTRLSAKPSFCFRASRALRRNLRPASLPRWAQTCSSFRLRPSSAPGQVFMSGKSRERWCEEECSHESRERVAEDNAHAECLGGNEPERLTPASALSRPQSSLRQQARHRRTWTHTSQDHSRCPVLSHTFSRSPNPGREGTTGRTCALPFALSEKARLPNASARVSRPILRTMSFYHAPEPCGSAWTKKSTSVRKSNKANILKAQACLFVSFRVLFPPQF